MSKNYVLPLFFAQVFCLPMMATTDDAIDDTKNLSGVVYNDALEIAKDSITSTAEIKEADVEYQSYGKIILKKGFKTAEGAKFLGIIIKEDGEDELRSAAVEPEMANVNDVESNNGIQIYPNPTDGELHINSNDVIKDINVTDMTGKVVLEKKVDANNVDLNLSSAPQGVYSLKVTTEKDSYVEKVVVK